MNMVGAVHWKRHAGHPKCPCLCLWTPNPSRSTHPRICLCDKRSAFMRLLDCAGALV